MLPDPSIGNYYRIKKSWQDRALVRFRIQTRFSHMYGFTHRKGSQRADPASVYARVPEGQGIFSSNSGSDVHYGLGERRIHSFPKSRQGVYNFTTSFKCVDVRAEKQTSSSMKPVSPIFVTLCLAAGFFQSIADQSQLVSECSKTSSLVYQEKGDCFVFVWHLDRINLFTK